MTAKKDRPISLCHSGRREASIRNLAGLKKIPGSPRRGAPE
jgi:hypothetical protein